MNGEQDGASGLLLVDKPAGITSHDVVDIARRAYGERSIGHLGTLDPFATGLLVLMLGRATRLLMLGDAIDAAEAERIGLVSMLADDDGLDAAVDGLARRLASGPSEAYAQTKALLTREQDMSLSGAIELEAMTQALLMNGRDYAEFHAAFTAGREPRWTGR